MKKNAGFTLVELIVVIAILAILAGIAIPVYSGYIAKAQEAADLTQLDAIKTATIFAYTEKQIQAEKDNIVVEQIVVNTSDGVVNTDAVYVNATFTATTDNDGKLTGGGTVGTKDTQSIKISDYVAGSEIKLNSSKFAKGAYWTAEKGWVGTDGAATVPTE